MLRFDSRWLVAALLTVLVGCFTAPVRRDPFAVLDVPNPALKELTLAVIISENTKASLEYGRQGAFAGFDPEALAEGSIRRLQDLVKAAIRVNSRAEAATVGADLIAVVDLLADMGGQAKFDKAITFLTVDGREVAVAQASAARPFGFNAGEAVTLAFQESDDKLFAAVKSSERLLAFAQSRKAARPATAVAEAPVPAPAGAAAPRSDVDRPTYRLPERANDFALVIGIEKYAELPAADFAERDAEAVHQHLLAQGYPARNVVRLTGNQAGRAGIEKYLESWLPRNVTAESRVFVYFSGHGAPEPKSGAAYLVPWDGDARFLENTGYPVERLYQKLEALAAREVLVVLDACFSGAGGRSVLAAGTRPLLAVKAAPVAESATKLLVLAASGADEITGTEQAQGHGLFTYHLLKGLSGAARDPRGAITVESLFRYLRPQVQDGARRQNRDQTPQLLPANPGGRAGAVLIPPSP